MNGLRKLSDCADSGALGLCNSCPRRNYNARIEAESSGRAEEKGKKSQAPYHTPKYPFLIDFHVKQLVVQEP